MASRNRGTVPLCRVAWVVLRWCPWTDPGRLPSAEEPRYDVGFLVGRFPWPGTQLYGRNSDGSLAGFSGVEQVVEEAAFMVEVDTGVLSVCSIWASRRPASTRGSTWCRLMWIATRSTTNSPSRPASTVIRPVIDAAGLPVSEVTICPMITDGTTTATAAAVFATLTPTRITCWARVSRRHSDPITDGLGAVMACPAIGRGACRRGSSRPTDRWSSWPARPWLVTLTTGPPVVRTGPVGTARPVRRYGATVRVGRERRDSAAWVLWRVWWDRATEVLWLVWWDRAT